MYGRLPRPTSPAHVAQVVTQAFDMIEQAPAWRFVADTVGFENDWSDAATGARRVRFCKTIENLVLVAGQITRTPAPTNPPQTMFTLPEEFRARHDTGFIVSASTIPASFAEVVTGGNGAVRFQATQASAPTENVFLKLDGIIFRAER